MEQGSNGESCEQWRSNVRAIPPADRGLPAGTVTLLFTGIEGSAQRCDSNRRS